VFIKKLLIILCKYSRLGFRGNYGAVDGRYNGFVLGVPHMIILCLKYTYITYNWYILFYGHPIRSILRLISKKLTVMNNRQGRTSSVMPISVNLLCRRHVVNETHTKNKFWPKWAPNTAQRPRNRSLASTENILVPWYYIIGLCKYYNNSDRNKWKGRKLWQKNKITR